MANNIELLRQALAASESSIKLAKQLLGDIEKGGVSGMSEKKVLPGIIGTFDGENMVTESGEKHPVPANYASKSLLVVGDVLKLVDEKEGKRFKQIEHVKRYRTKGVLTKKDGKFHVVASEGSYRVLPAAVSHFEANVGDELSILLPEKNMNASWGTLESLVKDKVDGKEGNVEQMPKEVADVKVVTSKEPSVQPKKGPERKEQSKTPNKEDLSKRVKPNEEKPSARAVRRSPSVLSSGSKESPSKPQAEVKEHKAPKNEEKSSSRSQVGGKEVKKVVATKVVEDEDELT